jgi:hypothetical protein
MTTPKVLPVRAIGFDRRLPLAGLIAILGAVATILVVGAGPASAASPPTVTTGQAVEVKRATAVLTEGFVNPEGAATAYYFEYGPEACKAIVGTCGAATETRGPFTEPLATAPLKLTRLKPGTTYHYWIVASNAMGTAHGEEQTFHTATAEPKEYLFDNVLAKRGSERPNTVAVNQVTGDVYVYSRGADPQIEQFDAAGEWQSSVEMAPSGGFQLAVDNSGGSEQGDVYVTSEHGLHTAGGAVYKFDRTGSSDPSDEGALLPDTTTPTIGEGVVSLPQGVAVDASGNVYIASASGTVSEFSSTGSVIEENLITGLFEPTALAIDAAGNIYVAGESGTTEYTPTGACVEPGVNPGECTNIDSESDKGVALDAAGDVFVSEAGTGTVREYGPAVGHPAIQNPVLEQAAEPRGLAVNDASRALYVAERGEREGGVQAVEAFRFFAAEPAAVETEPATSVDSAAAALNGTVNPNGGEAAEYYFEYGAAPCDGATGTCGTVASEQSELPLTGDAPIPVTVGLEGLAPDTTYHYWVVSVNEASGIEHGAERTFTTGSPESSQEQIPGETPLEVKTAGSPPPAFPLLTGIVPPTAPKAQPGKGKPKPKACRKGFERKKGRCVKRSHARRRKK